MVSIPAVATCGGRLLQTVKFKAPDHIASLSSQELQAIFRQMTIAKKLRTNLVVVSFVLCLCAPARAQTLIYSVSYAETRTSFHARYPNGAFRASINEKLAMLRSFRKTEIYSVSMIDGTRSLLFSDEGMNLDIKPTGPVYGTDKALVTGVRREWRTAPTPGAFADPPALYEINLDGSKQFRKLLGVQPNQSPALLNPRATKAVIEAFIDGKYLFFIYELPAWTLLRRWDLSKLTQARCPDCLPLSYGWLASGDRLFFNLVLGDEDLIDPKNHNIPGTYFVSEDGGDLGSISSETGRLQLPGHTQSSVAQRVLVAQLPNGSYLFQEYAAKEGSPGNPETFLVISGPDSKSQSQFPQKRLAGTVHVSPSGKYLAYVEERRLAPNFQPEPHLWGKDLQSGEEKELFIAPAPNPPTSPEPNVLLTVLGWAN